MNQFKLNQYLKYFHKYKNIKDIPKKKKLILWCDDGLDEFFYLIKK